MNSKSYDTTGTSYRPTVLHH